jgi:hypothetical protein
MRPINEIYPPRKNHTVYEIEWLVAAAAVSVMFWWLGWMIFQVVAGEK